MASVVVHQIDRCSLHFLVHFSDDPSRLPIVNDVSHVRHERDGGVLADPCATGPASGLTSDADCHENLLVTGPFDLETDSLCLGGFFHSGLRGLERVYHRYQRKESDHVDCVYTFHLEGFYEAVRENRTSNEIKDKIYILQ